MADIVTDLGINLMDEEIDEVIFQTNQFLTDATFTGSQGPFWWILQMCMALAALFSIIVAAGLAYKMMIKHEPLDILKLFRPLAVSIVLCWWYPPADTGIGNNGSSWCVLDFLAYIPNAIGSYTHDLYQAEASQIGDRFEEVQGLLHVRDTMYQNLQAQADVARTAEKLGADEQRQFPLVQPVVDGIDQHAGRQQRHDGRLHSRGQCVISHKASGPVEHGDDDKKQGGNVPFHKAIS